MPKRQVGLVVGKDFRPPAGASPLDWCFFTIDADDERFAVRVTRDQVDHADIGDVVRFKRPKSVDRPVRRMMRLYSAPARVPPPVWADPWSETGRHSAEQPPTEQRGHDEAEEEAADVRFPGHVGASQAELAHEPDRQKDEGRHRD